MPVAFKDSLDGILIKAGQYMDYDGLETIRKAYEFTLESNRRFDFLRMSGEPAIVHPLAVAAQLVEWRMDSETIAAGILHDTIEDPNIHKLQLRAIFGDAVAQLVEGVSKLKKYELPETFSEDDAYYMRIFMAVAKDIRVALIKMADRLHNMSTLHALPAYKQIKNCIETQMIFILMAERLGMREAMEEMRETAFMYLEPEEFENAGLMLENLTPEENEVFETAETMLRAALDDIGLEYALERVPHSPYFIGRLASDTAKPQSLLKTGHLEIITAESHDAYRALGVVHKIFSPFSRDSELRGVVHGFIDTMHHPSGDLKRSIETIVVGPGGAAISINILTEEMRLTNSRGVVSLLAAGSSLRDPGFLEERVKDLQRMIGEQSGLAEGEDAEKQVDRYLRLFREKKNFVFSSDGNALVLPESATVLDYAYKMSVDTGNRFKSAVINKKEVGMCHVPGRFEHLEILTDKDSRPRVEWLECVSTDYAKNEIMKRLSALNRDEAVCEGRRALLQRSYESGLCPSNRIEDLEQMLSMVADDFEIREIDDIYLNIVRGEINLQFVLEVVRTLYKRIIRLEDFEKAPRIIGHPAYDGEADPAAFVFDKPLKSSLYLDELCSPLPGDEIAVYGGLKKSVVHRKDCRNRRSKPIFFGRKTPAVWGDTSGLKFPARFKIKFFPAKDIQRQILNIIEKSGGEIMYPNDVNTSGRHLQLMEVVALVDNASHAANICDELLGLQEIAVAERV
jgi:GTP pyrophosphokinase